MSRADAGIGGGCRASRWVGSLSWAAQSSGHGVARSWHGVSRKWRELLCSGTGRLASVDPWAMIGAHHYEVESKPRPQRVLGTIRAREHATGAPARTVPKVITSGVCQTTPSAFNAVTAASFSPSQSLSTAPVSAPRTGDGLIRDGLPSTRTGQPGILNGRCTG